MNEASPEFIERLIGGEVEVLEGDVQGAFDDADYEDSDADDDDDGSFDDEGSDEDTDDPNEGAV